MTADMVLIVYAILLMCGGLMGFKKGSNISLIVGVCSGVLVLVGVWLLSVNTKLAWISLTALNGVLTLSFISRLLKTRKFMPSGMLLLITLAVLIFCLAHLGGNA